jgi:cystathionine beta-lyase/cystathionine gamma-synthase
MPEPAHRFGTRAIHAGQRPDPSTGAIMTPVYQTSTFVQSSPGVFKEGYDYARSKNPTRTALEANLASLEGGAHGLCFASGLGAMDCVLHLLSAGDHVILSDDVYGGSFRILDKVFKHLGLTTTRVDMTNLKNIEQAFTARTRLVWLETPSNPMLKVIDIAAVAGLVASRRSGVQAATAGAGMTASPGPGPSVLLVVDNTFATPYLQNPLALGADVVTHSCTKYIGGHSDVVGGALIVNDDTLAARLRFIQNAVGAVPGPMDCFFLLRSTKTLHVRVERHCQNAMRVAEWLTKHPKVEKVYYPGLPSHPQHEVAKRQMRGGFGGMVTGVLKGGLPEARRFLERVHLFSLAESLGGVESLIEHPAIMTHASVPAEARAALGIVDGLVRLSVGIEDAEDLIGDLDAALR